MRIGDKVFIYHSSCKSVGVVGIAKICSLPYVDPQQFNQASPYYDSKSTQSTPKWFVIDVEFVEKFEVLVKLQTMKGAADLQGLALFKQKRLSIVPVTALQWHAILNLA